LLDVAATAAEQHMDHADGIDRLGTLLANATDAQAEANVVMASLRTKMTGELRVREQERLAQQRLQAAIANDFTMAPSTTHTLAARVAALDVTFKVGPRKTHTEQFTPFPPTLLRMVITGISKDVDARENLRGFNMALMSPRVFWNVVRTSGGGDPDLALMELCPNLDWTFLEARQRELSEKALENERQAAVEAAELAEAKALKVQLKAEREERRAARAQAKRAKQQEGPASKSAKSQEGADSTEDES
jgi:hypothetical protein